MVAIKEMGGPDIPFHAGRTKLHTLNPNLKPETRKLNPVSPKPEEPETRNSKPETPSARHPRPETREPEYSKP